MGSKRYVCGSGRVQKHRKFVFELRLESFSSTRDDDGGCGTLCSMIGWTVVHSTRLVVAVGHGQ